MSIRSKDKQNVGNNDTCTIDDVSWEPESVILANRRIGIVLREHIEINIVDDESMPDCIENPLWEDFKTEAASVHSKFVELWIPHE